MNSPAVTVPAAEGAAAAAPPPAPEAPPTFKQKLENALKTLKDTKEIIVVVAFFAGGVTWVVDHFATREALDQVECTTKLNIRLLEATENINYNEELEKQDAAALSEQQNLLKNLKPGSDSSPVNKRINEINAELAAYDKTVASEKESAKKREAEISASSCFDQKSRGSVIDRLKHGDL
jgi:hypothetical protein